MRVRACVHVRVRMRMRTHPFRLSQRSLRPLPARPCEERVCTLFSPFSFSVPVLSPLLASHRTPEDCFRMAPFSRQVIFLSPAPYYKREHGTSVVLHCNIEIQPLFRLLPLGSVRHRPGLPPVKSCLAFTSVSAAHIVRVTSVGNKGL